MSTAVLNAPSLTNLQAPLHETIPRRLMIGSKLFLYDGRLHDSNDGDGAILRDKGYRLVQTKLRFSGTYLVRGKRIFEHLSSEIGAYTGRPVAITGHPHFQALTPSLLRARSQPWLTYINGNDDLTLQWKSAVQHSYESYKQHMPVAKLRCIEANVEPDHPMVQWVDGRCYVMCSGPACVGKCPFEPPHVFRLIDHWEASTELQHNPSFRKTMSMIDAYASRFNKLPDERVIFMSLFGCVRLLCKWCKCVDDLMFELELGPFFVQCTDDPGLLLIAHQIDTGELQVNFPGLEQSVGLSDDENELVNQLRLCAA